MQNNQMKSLSAGIILKLFILLQFFSCSIINIEPQYLTENVIIVVVDGARYSETWGDTTLMNIPQMRNKLAREGCVYTNFYNNGPTYTLAGHTSISTGFYQEINNTGLEYPEYPSFFQIWGNKFHHDSASSWIIASKDKIAVLANCNSVKWKNRNIPSTNCGVDGLGVSSGHRDDSSTFYKCLEILKEKHPKMLLLNFREPDYSGHQGNFVNYLKGIADTDKYLGELWDFIQADSIYTGKTALFVTNDHGRHLDSVLNGFASHGDGCEGCRHIFLFAAGPEFKKGQIIEQRREITDIPVTIAKLLNFEMHYANGKVMNELFQANE